MCWSGFSGGTESIGYIETDAGIDRQAGRQTGRQTDRYQRRQLMICCLQAGEPGELVV